MDLRRKVSQFLILILFSGYLFAENISLEEARNIALKQNQSLQIAEKELESATLQRKASRTRFLPSVSFTGTYLTKGDEWRFEKGPERLPVYDFSSGSPVQVADHYAVLKIDEKIGSQNTYLFNIGLTQPIFTGGKIVSQYNIAKGMEDISENKYELTRQETILKTDEAYWRVISLQNKLDAANSYRETVAKHLSNVQNYYDEGLVTENEVLKVTVKFNEAQLLVLKAENGLNLSKMALNQILGFPLNMELTLTDQGFATEYLPEENTGSIENRAEILMLKSSVEITKNYHNINKSRYMPNIVLNAGYKWINPNPYDSFKDNFGNDWTLAVVAQMELFNWNQRAYLSTSAKRTKESAILRLEETKELINLEITQAEYRLKEAQKKLILTENSYTQAQRNLDITSDKFLQGIAKNSDVLEAQTLWHKAHTEFIDAQTEYHNQITLYKKAIGKL